MVTITVDVPTDQPWHYRTTRDRAPEVIAAFATLGHRIISVEEDQS
jgi:hypothetical protein